MMETVITVIPKAKHLTIYHHSHENIVGQIHLENTENVIISAALDIIAYCAIRIKMVSSTLSDIHKYELLMEQYFG